MLEHLIHLVTRLGIWGYAILFLVAALECSAFVGLVVPGESLVTVAGVLAQQHVLDLEVAWWSVFAGAVLGDSVGYALGRHFGRPWLLRHGHRAGITEDRMWDTEQYMRSHGGKSVLVGRFIGFARALVPFIAGAGHMRYPIFLVFDAVGAALWAVGFMALGYTLGASWHEVEHWIGRTTTALGVVVVVLVALFWWLRRRRARR